jgi:GT2 family glycosyltransferase
MRIAVAILNWNGLGHLQTYIPSVVEHSQVDDVEIYVIDNGSTDASREWLTNNHPGVKQVKLDRNYGFALGYNLGLASISADRFVLLNSDVRVSQGWIASVNQTMSDLGLTACSPLIMDDSKPGDYEYSGAAGGYIDRDGFMFCAGRIFDTFEADKGIYSVDKEVFWASINYR